MIEGILLNTVIGALLPVVSDGFASIIQRLTGGSGALPKNVDDVIKLRTAEIDSLRALAALDAPGQNVSLWVADLRAAFRPIIAITAFTAAVVAMFLPAVPEATAEMIFGMASMVSAYLFGERFMLGMKGMKK